VDNRASQVERRRILLWFTRSPSSEIVFASGVGSHTSGVPGWAMDTGPAQLTATCLRRHTDRNKVDKDGRVLDFLAGISTPSSPVKSQTSKASSRSRPSLVASMRPRMSRSGSLSSPILKARVDSAGNQAPGPSKAKPHYSRSQTKKKHSSGDYNKRGGESDKENRDPRKGVRGGHAEEIDDPLARPSPKFEVILLV
jgi:hypothetical protein